MVRIDLGNEQRNVAPPCPLFFAVITPMAWIRRALGNDPLRLRFDREARTYWVDRQPPGPPPETLTNQF